MNPQELSQLQETLRASTSLALEFSDLLQKEKQALTSLEKDTVTSLLEQKELLIQQLSAYQKTILHFCESNKTQPSYSALRSFLYRLGLDPSQAESILADWVELKNNLIKNQALNKTNEAILEELIRRNQIKQTIIHNLGRQSDTYSASGQQNSRSMNGWVEQV